MGNTIRSRTLKVDGLRELNRSLRAIGPEAQVELKEASRKVAQFVADDAKAAAMSLGGLAEKTAPSIKPVGGVNGAGVAFGGARYPFGGVAEFGAYATKRTGWYANKPLGKPQFEPWRGNDRGAGYFVYPSIRQDEDRIFTEFTDAVDGILKRRFPG